MRLPDNKKLIVIVVLAVMLSVFLTLIIVFANINSDEKYASTKKADVEKNYENSYILSCDEGRVEYLYKGEKYFAEGTVSDNCVGVADILVENGKLKKIRLKEAIITGTVLAYTEDYLKLDEYGEVQCVKEFPIYNTTGDIVEQQNSQMLIVGNSQLKFVLENNVICAAIIDHNVQVKTVRVLLKNGNSIYYDNLFIKDNTREFEAKDYFKSGDEKETVVEAADGFLYLGRDKSEYRKNGYLGTMRVIKTEKGFVVVNELPIEEYLRFVLPSEMPTSFEFEALKAQAVCARTFVYSQMRSGEYAQFGANIDDSTAFQVYNSTGTFDITDKAVWETTGQVVKYDGDYAVCYYFSTCGDRTKTLEVWDNDDKVGYIKSVKSKDKSSPFYRWKAKINLKQIEDEQLGMLKSFEKDKKLVAHFENGDKTFTRENEIRFFLGAGLMEVSLNSGDKRTDMTALPSAYFTVTDTKDGICNVMGRGFGHGIGMSQYGANEMAKKHKNYKDIILYYYNDVTIEKMEE